MEVIMYVCLCMCMKFIFFIFKDSFETNGSKKLT